MFGRYTDKWAEEAVQSAVGDRRGVRLACRDEQLEPGLARLELLEQPGLADARLADELEETGRSPTRGVECGGEGLELRVAPDDRELVPTCDVAAEHGADAVRRDGPLFPLHEQRLRLRLVPCPRCVEHRGRRQHFADVGSGSETRGEVDGVARDGVRAPVLGTDVACECDAAVHAGTELEAHIGRHDSP